jgi:putative flippase GtrA
VPEAPALARTAGRYGVVSAACVVLNVAIVYVGHDLLHAPYLLAALATVFITIPLSYAAHRQFSFRVAQAAGWGEFARFLAQQLSQFGLGLVLLAGCVELLGLPPALGMVVVSALMFAYGLLTNDRWVFRGARRS